MKRVINCPSCSRNADYNTEHQVLESECTNPDGSVTRYYKVRHDCGHSFADTIHTPPPWTAPLQDMSPLKPAMISFDSGAKRGSDEIRYDLLPIEMLERTTTAFEEGEVTYGANNYKKGIPVRNLLNHAIRHLFQYQDWLSQEDRRVCSEDHIAHALANLGMLCWMEVHKNDNK